MTKKSKVSDPQAEAIKLVIALVAVLALVGFLAVVSPGAFLIGILVLLPLATLT